MKEYVKHYLLELSSRNTCEGSTELPVLERVSECAISCTTRCSSSLRLFSVFVQPNDMYASKTMRCGARHSSQVWAAVCARGTGGTPTARRRASQRWTPVRAGAPECSWTSQALAVCPLCTSESSHTLEMIIQKYFMIYDIALK